MGNTYWLDNPLLSKCLACSNCLLSHTSFCQHLTAEGPVHLLNQDQQCSIPGMLPCDGCYGKGMPYAACGQIMRYSDVVFELRIAHCRWLIHMHRAWTMDNMTIRTHRRMSKI